MPRRAKRTTEPNEATSQAAPPAESEEGRLIRVGRAMLVARDVKEGTPTREEVEASLVTEGGGDPLTALPPDTRRRFIELGKQDPRPFVERLKQTCQELLVLRQGHGEERRLVERMQSTLSDLELVLAVRRYGGRRKGTRKKEVAEQIGNIRQWAAGDRTWVGGSSVRDVADKLKVSRQTVYTILGEIKAEGKGIGMTQP